MVWTAETSQGNESAKIKWELVPYTRGRGLDLGCGPYKPFAHFIGVDNGHHAQMFGWQFKPDLIVNTCEKLDLIATQSMDFVFSSHLLEHIEDYRAALREWWRVVKPNGFLCLYLPHGDFYPNIGTTGANPDHKHDFRPADIVEAMGDLKGWDLVEKQDRNEGNEYSFFMVFKKLGVNVHRFSCDDPRPVKSAGIVRYGAFGDLMQASSVIAALKEDGYHVTLYSSPPGSDVILHDPNIDKIILQDKDQVVNGELGDFWKYIAKKYDKFVNLSESVEGSLLALPGRTPHAWPKQVRHYMMNRNYLQFQHSIAQTEYKPKVRFYATEEEKAWAKKQRSKMGKFVIVWSLAGSSVHKAWPHLDNVVASLMLNYSDVDVVFVGGPEAVILEAGWENEPRVHRTCGQWTIRQSLSFLDEADLVIGPETGVLNAASCLSVPKIVFLSHSSHENLTLDWKNVTPLHTQTTECYPCHQLHYGWDYCKKHEESGTADCQWTIAPDQVIWAIENWYRGYHKRLA